MRRRGVAALAAACGIGGAVAGEPTVAPTLSGLQLRERGADGSVLVRERGALAGLRAGWRGGAGSGGRSWSAGLALAAGEVDYDGRTQGGRALASRTATALLRADLGLAVPIAGAWSAEAGVEGEWYRRRIEASGTAAGLDERLAQARLRGGIAWRGASWSAGAALLAGGRAPLRVRFDGDRFDPVTLRSGQARGLVLQVDRRLAPGWRLEAGVERIDVGASLPRALTSGGQTVGTLRQPAWRRDLVWLAAVWSPGG